MEHDSPKGQGRKLSRQLSHLSIASELPESSTSSSNSEQHSSLHCWADSDTDDCSPNPSQSYRRLSPATSVQLQPRRSSSSSSPESPRPYPHPSHSRGFQSPDPRQSPGRVQQQQEAGTKLIVLKQKRKGSQSQALKASARKSGSKAQHAQSKMHGAHVYTGQHQRQLQQQRHRAKHRSEQADGQRNVDYNEQPSTHRRHSAAAAGAAQNPPPAQQKPSRKRGNLPCRDANSTTHYRHYACGSVSSEEESGGSSVLRHSSRTQHDAQLSPGKSLRPMARPQDGQDRQQRLKPSRKPHSSAAALEHKQPLREHLQESAQAHAHQQGLPNQASRSFIEDYSLPAGSSQAQQQQVEVQPGSGQGLGGAALVTDSTAAAPMDVEQTQPASVPAMSHGSPQRDAALATAVDIATCQSTSPHLAADSPVNNQPPPLSLGASQTTSAEQRGNASSSPKLQNTGLGPPVAGLQGTGGGCEAGSALPGAMQALMIALENMTSTHQQKLMSSQQTSHTTSAAGPVAAAAPAASDAAAAAAAADAVGSPLAGTHSDAGCME